jgi:hypothetical protein
MKKYKIVEANDVTHNLTFLKPKFEVKRCVHKTKFTKFSNSGSSLQKWIYYTCYAQLFYWLPTSRKIYY